MNDVNWSWDSDLHSYTPSKLLSGTKRGRQFLNKRSITKKINKKKEKTNFVILGQFSYLKVTGKTNL